MAPGPQLRPLDALPALATVVLQALREVAEGAAKPASGRCRSLSVRLEEQ